MIADKLVPPIIMIIILIISIIKWIESSIRTKKLAGIGAILIRIYLLYVFILIDQIRAISPELSKLALRSGLAVLLVDECIYWLTHKFHKLYVIIKRKIKSYKKSERKQGN